ncbi:MAG: hypothetical protein IT435_08325 [Phycisphaerales bacterium]|nr:hypothetical protein [Phycisphaerales bacterium]
MTMENLNINRMQDNGLDADLVATSTAIDELAARDACAAGRGFEDRLAIATMPRIGARDSGDEIVYSFKAHAARDSWVRPMRLAAMIALAASAGFVWFATRPAPVAAPVAPEEVAAALSPVEQDVEVWLGITDTEIAFARAEVDELAIDSDILDESLGGEPSAGAWFLEGESL